MQSQYTQDVEFNSGFGALQTPIHIYTAAILCGYAGVELKQKFRYLDLACGNGHTLSLLADAYPESEFVGIDINHSHIEQAKKTAQKANLTNLSFIQADVAELEAKNYQSFDFCTVSGVFSWLDEYRQTKLIEFVTQVVRAGGLLYLDYSAQPGMSQNATLYKMVQKLSPQYPGNSAARLTGAVTMLHTLRNAGGQFFKQNSGASERLTNIMENPAEDEAHEVLNLQQQGLWSADVIASLKQHKFAYLGNIGLHHNLKAFSKHLSLPDGVENFPVETQQMIFDVAWNVSQRKDLYVNGSPTTPTGILDALKDKAFYIAPGALHEQKLAFLLKQFPGANLLTRSNITRLQGGQDCATFAELESLYVAAGMTLLDVAELFSQLLAARLISIALMAPNNQVPATLTMPSKLNRLILEEDIHLEHARPFVSPVVGSRLILPIKDRLYLWAIVHGDVASAWDRMGELTSIFQDFQGQTIDKKSFIHIINQSLPAFNSKAVPELVRLGILA